MANYYASMMQKEKRKVKRRRLLSFVLWILILLILGAGYFGYSMVFRPNVWTDGKPSVNIDIPTGTTWEQLKAGFYKQGLIVHRNSFEWMASLMKYPGHIKAGHYVIRAGMSNRQLIAKLRSGDQDPVKLIFNNIRTKEDLAGHIAEQIETDSLSLIRQLNDKELTAKYGFTPATILTMFIPNTYSVYWNISPDRFLERMFKEYNAFWNESRKTQLLETGLSRLEVMTLASIVEKETNRNDEKQDVAGVYMNRLQKGWLLQADPTLVFALGDFSIKRVLNIYKKIDSPYNTYMYYGLPPGPICMPSVSSIDAVLNYHKHQYMYFCAREDFSGYHNFAVTQQEHEINARKYQDALNRQGIMK